jgi:uncharacterized protein (TIGR02246 family)
MMHAENPHMVVTLLASALRDLDVTAIMALYEEDAALSISPGMLCKGTASIRKFYEGFFKLNPNIRYEMKNIAECSDLALFTAKWTTLSPIPAGLPISKTNYQACILRKQANGHWLIALNNPFGVAPALPR